MITYANFLAIVRTSLKPPLNFASYIDKYDERDDKDEQHNNYYKENDDDITLTLIMMIANTIMISKK